MKTSQNLIKISKDIFNNETKETINARDLHDFLESKQQFADWIKNRIEKYGFIENEDFILISENYEIKRGRGGDRRTIDYHITLDMAKELAMIENNEKGRQIRKYFIECEKKLMQVPKITRSNNELPVVFENEVTDYYERDDGFIVAKVPNNKLIPFAKGSIVFVEKKNGFTESGYYLLKINNALIIRFILKTEALDFYLITTNNSKFDERALKTTDFEYINKIIIGRIAGYINIYSNKIFDLLKTN